MLFPGCDAKWVRANEKHPETYVSRCFYLVGAGGFEPPKLKAADLQSVPIGHSGTRPYSFVCPAGRLIYFSMEGWICQHFSANFCRRFSKPGSGQKSPVGARKKGTRRGLEAYAFFLQISEKSVSDAGCVIAGLGSLHDGVGGHGGAAHSVHVGGVASHDGISHGGSSSLA